MVKLFVIVFVLLFSLYANLIECNHFTIANNGNRILFKKNTSLLKEVSISEKIQKINCFYNKFVVIITPTNLFITTPNGKLLKKKDFFKSLQYMYSDNTTIYFKKDNQYLKYSIDKNGNISISHVFIDITKKPIFLSKNKKNKNVIFYNNYYTVNNESYKISPLYIKKDIMYYFDINLKNIYFANNLFYKNKVSKVYFTSLYKNGNDFIQNFRKLKQNLASDILLKFSSLNLRKKLLFTYLSNYKKNEITKKLIKKLIAQNGITNYYMVLKKSGYIQIPNYGDFNLYNIYNLKNKLQNFIKSEDFIYFKKNGAFNYKIKYPKSVKNTELIITYFLDKKKLFTLKIPVKYTLYKRYKEKGHRYQGFLILTTVVYDSMFEIKKYRYTLSKNTIAKIKNTTKILENNVRNIEHLHLKNQWEFTTKKFLYDISAHQTAIGKALSNGLKKDQTEGSCDKIYNKCMNSCKYKSSKGFFNDKDSCQNACIGGKNACERGNYTLGKITSCRGICKGVSASDGDLFGWGASSFDKCVDSCTDKIGN